MKLYKGIIVTVLIMVATKLAYSQVRFDAGLKGGVNFSSINVNSSIAKNLYNKTGLHFGIYTMVKFKRFALQPEFVFSKQGNTFTFPNTSTELENNFDYLNIPVILKYYISEGLNVQVGPQFGFLTGSKGAIVDIDKNQNRINSSNQDITNYVKSLDISLALGVGWDLPFGLNIAARYNMGLTDINKFTNNLIPSQVSSMESKSSKNQVYQLSVGFRLFSTLKKEITYTK